MERAIWKGSHNPNYLRDLWSQWLLTHLHPLGWSSRAGHFPALPMAFKLLIHSKGVEGPVPQTSCPWVVAAVHLPMLQNRHTLGSLGCFLWREEILVEKSYQKKGMLASSVILWQRKWWAFVENDASKTTNMKINGPFMGGYVHVFGG